MKYWQIYWCINWSTESEKKKPYLVSSREESCMRTRTNMEPSARNDGVSSCRFPSPQPYRDQRYNLFQRIKRASTNLCLCLFIYFPWIEELAWEDKLLEKRQGCLRLCASQTRLYLIRILL